MVLNALAACAVGLEVGVTIEDIKKALATLPRIGRRMEVLAQKNDITVISDYGHHPTEIGATLAAVRDSWMQAHRRLRVVFEPHRFSRTKDCYEQFLDAFGAADELIMGDIYAAGEPPIDGISGERLFEEIRHTSKRWVPKLGDVPTLLQNEVEAGDLILFMGAGPIGGVGEQFAQSVRER
jgi:UDP-N-acetylmuramate--alanine ligase